MEQDVCEALASWIGYGGNASPFSRHFRVLVRNLSRKSATSSALKQLTNLFMFTWTAKWRQLSAMQTSSRCLFGIVKCRLCWVAPALCPASDPRNYPIAISPTCRGAHLTESRIARRCCAIRRDSTNPAGFLSFVCPKCSIKQIILWQFQPYWWYRAPFFSSDIFICSDKMVCIALQHWWKWVYGLWFRVGFRV